MSNVQAPPIVHAVELQLIVLVLRMRAVVGDIVAESFTVSVDCSCR